MSAAVVSILIPVSEEAENRKQEAKKHWGAITKAGGLVSVNSLRIGFHAYALKKDSLFGILGFENEKQAQEASGVGDSTWFAMIRLAEQFSGVGEELFVGMKQANAKALADLPESKRLTEYWLRRAATDPTDTFKAVIEEELDGKARESDGKERTVSYSVKMPTSRRKAVQSGLLEYAKEVGVEGDESRALELLVAEKTGTPSLIGVIISAVQKLKSVKNLCESGLSSDEVLAKVVVLNEEMILEFATALQNLDPAQ
jgi:hypothetical protein